MNQQELETVFKNQIDDVRYNFFKGTQLNFTTLACTGDVTRFEEDFEKLFSETDGIAPLISRLTHEGKSIYYLPNVIKDRLQNLKKEYYNKFKYHIERYNPNSIADKFHELYNDIFSITERGLITHISGPSLKETLERRKI